jgi:PD-(D/E)XK endonuclease
MLTTDQKGAVAETAIAFAAIKLGIGVYRPLFEGGRYDFIFEVDGDLYRVQCKWASLDGDVVDVRCYSSRRSRRGLVRRSYTQSEVDLIAVYCPPIDRCYVVPADRFHGHPTIRLRVAPSRNNQRIGVNWADDFAFERLTWLPNQGAVAQLGERLAGSQKATGSSPVGSTDEAAHDGRLRLL